MFGLMANCFEWCKGRSKLPKDIKLVILGLDDAGKTTTIASLEGEPPEGITPTVGFSNANLDIGKWKITIYDLGGAEAVRSVWEKYYAEIYGILFTVDSSNPSRIEESRDAIATAYKNEKVQGKPIVVFANKQDKEGSLSAAEVTEELELADLSEQRGFKYNVFPCSAIKGYGKTIDKSIKDGLNWLLKEIAVDITNLHERVQADSAVQREIEAKERKARLERMRILREQREKEKEEAGIQDEEEDDDDDVQGPFRKIDDQIGITAKREKKEKENKKKIELARAQKQAQI